MASAGVEQKGVEGILGSTDVAASGAAASPEWSEVGTECKKRVYICTNRCALDVANHCAYRFITFIYLHVNTKLCIFCVSASFGCA